MPARTNANIINIPQQSRFFQSFPNGEPLGAAATKVNRQNQNTTPTR